MSVCACGYKNVVFYFIIRVWTRVTGESVTRRTFTFLIVSKQNKVIRDPKQKRCVDKSIGTEQESLIITNVMN